MADGNGPVDFTSNVDNFLRSLVKWRRKEM